MILFDIIVAAVIFILGLCIGSFLNVCIYRLPAGKSIAFPASHCPQCKAAIRFSDNIPVIGWLRLKGRCRNCRAAISWRYPLVEFLTGGFALCLFLKFGLHIETIIYFVFTAILIVITFIDIDHRIIPDILTLPGIPLAFVAALFLPQMTWQNSLVGILVGGGTLLLVAVGYATITGKEGMGGGDIKLLAMIGALCGWMGVLFTIFFGSVLGSVVGVISMRGGSEGMKLKIPFGPFLSVGAIAYIFFGSELIQWYLFTMGR